jgi:N-acetylglucosaminyldiphosphoundecaprenol N-acetyl-beta-D-mannosaminyltransferase
VKVAMGVGGLFDFYSGHTSRAPQWMREIGLEWVYRFLQEPGRMWKRYFLGNALFLFRIFKERNRPSSPVA